MINSTIKENPHSEIHVLSYTKFKSEFDLISNISKVHYINETLIANAKENHLFSDSFAINSLFETIDECSAESWDKLINFSNDAVSSYLCSMFDAKEKIGTTISKLGSPLTSNKWATYLNFVNSQRSNHVIHNNQVRHHMAGVPYYTEGNKIKINEEYSSVAAQNFAKIRRSKAETANANIIGISLAKATNGEEIDFHSLCEMIDILESSANFKPVLLISGKTHEKEIANELNYKFDNSLISINTDDSAFASVVMNVDALITAKNKHLLIADSVETRIIEVVPNSDQYSTSYSTNPGNFVILQGPNNNIVDDVNFILNQEFESDLPVSSMTSNNKVYAIIEDDYGTLATQIHGELDLQSELRYHVERCYHYQLLGYPRNSELIEHLRNNTVKEELTSFTTQIKDELTDTVKILLATLRSLKGVKQSKNNLHNFITYLDTLIQKGKTNSVTSGAISLFEGAIENINTDNSDDNIKAIEKNLFDLKNDLQILTNMLTDLVSDKRDVEQANLEA